MCIVGQRWEEGERDEERGEKGTQEKGSWCQTQVQEEEIRGCQL